MFRFLCALSADNFYIGLCKPPKFPTQAFATTSRRGSTSSVEDSAPATCKMTCRGRTRPAGRQPTATVINRSPGRRRNAERRRSPPTRPSAARWRQQRPLVLVGSADSPTTRGHLLTATAAEYCLLSTSLTSTGQSLEASH